MIVVKYAYVPFGKSGVTQNLPLFSSKTSSSFTFTYVKSSTKKPAPKGGLFDFFEDSSTYPERIGTMVPPVFVEYPYGP